MTDGSWVHMFGCSDDTELWLWWFETPSTIEDTFGPESLTS
jgi:hypothetical protein